VSCVISHEYCSLPFVWTSPACLACDLLICFHFNNLHLCSVSNYAASVSSLGAGYRVLRLTSYVGRGLLVWILWYCTVLDRC
jgi:hypothetical protein